MLINQKVKFLAICNPDLYKNPYMDVPRFYEQVAMDTRIDFSHIFSHDVFNTSTEENHIKVTPISDSLPYEGFLELEHRLSQYDTIDSFDLVFCRTLKPFPEGYLQKLSQWEKYTRFINSPRSKIEQIQADFLVKVAADYLPETIVTDNWQEALNFLDKHGTIVAKQVNSCGGRGIFKISYLNQLFVVDNLFLGTKEFDDFPQVITYTMGKTNQPLQLVRYLHRVSQGDKRIVVVDKEIYGAYIRRSKSGHWVNNVSGDGECFLADISDMEKEAIAKTVPHYKQLGLHTLGYDFLQDDEGNWLISEINVGNIGGFARLEQLTGQPIMTKFTDWLVNFARSPQNLLTA